MGWNVRGIFTPGQEMTLTKQDWIFITECPNGTLIFRTKMGAVLTIPGDVAEAWYKDIGWIK